MEIEIQNPNPIIHEHKETLLEQELILRKKRELDDEIADEIDSLEGFFVIFFRFLRWKNKVFDFIKNINDPEHPLTLEQLDIVSYQNIAIDKHTNSILVYFKPTIPHCSVANLIGLMIRTKLSRSLSSRFKVCIYIVIIHFS